MNRKVGVILSYILMVFEVLSTLLLTPFIIRTLGGAEYGVYKLSSAIVAYLLLLDFGIGNAVIRYVAKFKTQNEITQSRKFLGITTVYYSVVALISIIAGIVLILIYPSVFSKGLSADEIVLGQKLLAITMVNVAVTLGTAGFYNTIVAYERFDISRGASIVQIIIRIGLTVLVLKLGMGSIGIVSVNLLMTCIFRFFFVFFVLFRLKLKPIFKNIEIGMIKDVVVYSSFILIQMVATQINACADSVLIGAFAKSSAVIIGVYGVGQQISQYFQSIGSSVNGVLMPGVVKLVEGKASPEQLCNEMVRIGRLIFMLLGIIWSCFFVFGRQFVVLWVGEENSQAYIVALLLMLAHCIIITESIGTQVLWAMNEHKEQAILKMSIVAVNIILTILLIKWQPLLGATIGTFISLALGDVLVMNIVFKKKIGISLLSYYRGLFKGILPCLVIAVAFGWLFSLIKLSGWVGFAVNVACMLLVYAGCMWLFGINSYEKNMFTDLLKKLKIFSAAKKK